MDANCSLHDFLSFLKLSCDFEFDIDKHTFSERIRLQKYVFLAQKLGLSTSVPLDYSMYIRGPYSSALADVYFNANSWERPIFDTRSFDSPLFVRALSNRDVHWLEVAATIVYVTEFTLSRYDTSFTIDEIIESVQRFKTFSDMEITSVYSFLVQNKII